MTTIATNNLSPAIHSRGFFSRAIHRDSRCLRQKLSQTAHTAQFNCKLQPFYAKQTQFAAHPNERNYCTNNGLSKYQTIQTPEKQTQFQPHHLRSAQPTIKMQNKPNSQNAKMYLTSYEHRDYEQEAPLRTPPKQTQSNPILQRTGNPPTANPRRTFSEPPVAGAGQKNSFLYEKNGHHFVIHIDVRQCWDSWDAIECLKTGCSY